MVKFGIFGVEKLDLYEWNWGRRIPKGTDTNRNWGAISRAKGGVWGYLC
jgi:hypothetical protein